MKRFSERIGAVKPGIPIINEMSNGLRVSFWNLMLHLYKNEWHEVSEHVARFANIPADDLPLYPDDRRRWVKDFFFGLQWHEAFDFIEFLYSRHYSAFQKYCSQENLKNKLNKIMKDKLCGYRFVGEVLVSIIAESEVESIEQALQLTTINQLVGPHEHLKNASILLAKRPDPDYRNSVKESISAVESLVKGMSGKAGNGLKDALERLSNDIRIHNSLKKGFISLYGYASDEGGIRHAILEYSDVGFSEAKYMLVTCSAFVNFIICKKVDAGL